jgi:iturin family lipopeptide synthetase A
MTNTVSPGVDQPPSSVRDLLATAIAEVTGLDDASLDAQANPIELGIDSLMIMQINTRLHRSLGVELPNELFFDPAATLAQLTQQLAEQAEPARVEALATGSGEGEGSATGPAADTTAGTALVPSASESLPSVAIGQAGGLPQAPSAGLTEVQGLTPPQAIAPVPAPAAPAGQPDAAGRSMLESLMHQQLQTFAELTRQQIEAFQRVGSAPPPPSAAAPLQAAVAPAPPAPQATADPTTAQPARPRSSVQRDDPASASPKAIPTAPPSAATPPVPPLPDQGVATERKPFVPYRAVSEAATRARPTITDTALGELTREYCAQTPTTKSRTQTDRAAFANNRNIAGFTPALKEMTYQVIAERASGAHIWDPDGNRFVDITQGFGSSLLGHSHPAVAEAIREQLDRTYAVGPISNDAGDVARRICRLTGAERVAFYNSGTEAVMVATRLARTATGRAKVVCFEGAYHGMFDGVLALPDRGASTPGTAMPLAPGVTEHMVADTVVLPYNDPESLQHHRTARGGGRRRHCRTGAEPATGREAPPLPAAATGAHRAHRQRVDLR